MKYLKKFNESIEQGSRIGKRNLLPFKSKTILDQIELYKIDERIYAVKISERRVRALLFLRYQEFYESQFSEIFNMDFEINDFINLYTKNSNRDNLFTYNIDWSGFNLPSTSIEKCMKGIKDPNEYDRIFSEIIKSIREEYPTGNYYLLGVDNLTSDLMDHEVAHALYFTNPEYKKEMDSIIESMVNETRVGLSDIIIEMGYNKDVVYDEIQAYMSTGLSDEMSEIDKIKKYTGKFKSTFEKYRDREKEPVLINFK
jgi:hypothetical protein